MAGKRSLRTAQPAEHGYDAHVESYRLSNAWKAPLPPASSSAFYPGEEGTFYRAVMIYHECDDIAPLLDYLRSDRPRSAADRESLARFVELLHARSRSGDGQGRRSGDCQGRPSALIMRWRTPAYVAALMFECKIEVWKTRNRRRPLPDEEIEDRKVTPAIKAKIMEELLKKLREKNSPAMQGKRPLTSHDIEKVLGYSKRRRL